MAANRVADLTVAELEALIKKIVHEFGTGAIE